MGRGRFLPRERVAGECRDAPVHGFHSTAYAAARMDRGRLPQVVRRKPSVDRIPERVRDLRDQPADLRARAPRRGPARRNRRVDSIRIRLAGLSLPRLRARELRRAPAYPRRARRARRPDAADTQGREFWTASLPRLRNQTDGGDRVPRDARFRRGRAPPNRHRGRVRRHLHARARRVQRYPLSALRQRVHLPDFRVPFFEGARHRRRHRDLPANDPRRAGAAVRPRLLANLRRARFQSRHIARARDRRRRVRFLWRVEPDRVGPQLSRADPVYRDRRGRRRDRAG